MKLKSLIKKIENKYPLNLAYDWDNVGLLVGDFEMDIKKVLVTLEANDKVIDEAINENVDLIITHHPFIFRKLNKVNTGDLKGKLIHKLIKNDIALYSMHTNFDIAFDGLNDYFMEKIGIESTGVLEATDTEVLFKLAVYVPETHSVKLREVLGKSGAGSLGNYSNCSFSINGTGTFKPEDGSNPYIGDEGKIEHVNEVKIETIVPQKILGGVINNMIKAHPYEEVAYDIYKLENKGQIAGLGRVAKLEEKTTLKELTNLIKDKLNMDKIRIVGNIDTEISKIAVVTGAGADMVKKAQRQNAQVIITGDVKYHDAQDALDMGMCIVDCGHFETEDIFKEAMKRFLDEVNEIDVIESNVYLNPFMLV